jgi:hypothetical protein
MVGTADEWTGFNVANPDAFAMPFEGGKFFR